MTPPTESTPRRRALLSVYDKTGVVTLARTLVDLGWELISSGGTHRTLTEAGMPVLAVADVTGAAEMLGGRVKTLHPAIHGGILADRSPDHAAQLADRNIAPIDLVVSNLYPFVAEPSIEQIDIGGPTMVRAAAKNHAHVGIVVDPEDYAAVIAELRDGDLSSATRQRLARKAFAHTAAYDAAIVGWFDDQSAHDEDTESVMPPTLHLALSKQADLRYGENPHQSGALYTATHGADSWWDEATQHHGKAMSYLNVYDTQAAWSLVHQIGNLDQPAAVVIKHANPCGAAVAPTIAEAYRRAHEGDPVSAFGGIVAINRTVDSSVAEAIGDVFTEVVIAPDFEADALEALMTKKNIRLFSATAPNTGRLNLRSIAGGWLAQTPDAVHVDRAAWTVATDRHPTPGEWSDLEFAWRLAARVTSNTIVLAKDLQAVGIGAGQQNRRDAGRIAADKADGRAVGGACASDAFFPFRDGLDAAIDAGCTAVIQPGGSIRDEEVIGAANDAGIAMVFTGQRHFLH